MPIRFSCTHCQQRLSVGSRRAGTQVRCPKCLESVNVPSSDGLPAAKLAGESTDELAKPSAIATGSTRERPMSLGKTGDEGIASPPTPVSLPPRLTPPPVPPVSPLLAAAAASAADEATWVYDEDELPEPTARAGDAERILVPRSVLYIQGILLGVVGLGCFIFGVMVGSRSVAPTQVSACTITGRVTVRGGNSPDVGAVVIAVPVNGRPEDRLDARGLHPGDPPPSATAIARIREMSGDYARTNDQGQYRLRVPEPGKYYLLFVSASATRDPSQQINRQDLGQVGRYFEPASDLIGVSSYSWRENLVRADRTIDHRFPL